MLGALGLKILLIDEAATARTLKLREPADRAQRAKDSRSPSVPANAA